MEYDVKCDSFVDRSGEECPKPNLFEKTHLLIESETGLTYRERYYSNEHES